MTLVSAGHGAKPEVKEIRQAQTGKVQSRPEVWRCGAGHMSPSHTACAVNMARAHKVCSNGRLARGGPDPASGGRSFQRLIIRLKVEDN